MLALEIRFQNANTVNLVRITIHLFVCECVLLAMPLDFCWVDRWKGKRRSAKQWVNGWYSIPELYILNLFSVNMERGLSCKFGFPCILSKQFHLALRTPYKYNKLIVL